MGDRSDEIPVTVDRLPPAPIVGNWTGGTIVPIDAQSPEAPALMTQWTAVTREATEHLFGKDHPRAQVARLAPPMAKEGQVTEFFLAVDHHGVAVGAGSVSVPGQTGPDDAEVLVSVLPSARDGGIGRSLVAHGGQRALAQGCTRVVLDQSSPDPDGGPGAAFARAMGCREVGLVLGSVLQLPVDPDRLAALETEARAAYENDYEIHTASGELPESWLEERAALAGELSSQAPSGSIEHVGDIWDAERVRTLLMRWKSGGGNVVESVAFARTPPAMVAYSDLVIYESNSQMATQSDTLVLDEHRGRGLGAAVKVANLHALAEDFPQVQLIMTWTWADNTPMQAVNERLGFETVEWTRLWARDLV